MRMWVWSMASLSGLKLWCCHELWCRLKRQLGPHAAVAVAQAGSYSSDLTLSLGTSICHRRSPKKKKKKKVNGFWKNVSHLIIVSPLSCFPITNILLHFRSIITNSPLLGFLSLSLIRMQNLSPLYPSDTNIFTGVISKILFLQSFFILHILSYSSWFPISYNGWKIP